MNFLDEPTYPSPIGVTPALLWNETDEALFAGITGVEHWVQISSASQQGPQGDIGPQGDTGLIGPQGDIGETGAQGETGILNFLDNPTYPAPIGVTPVLLWNEVDETLFAGVTGVGNWVQISSASNTQYIQCAAVSDATSTDDVVAQFNALLASLRAGGIILT